MATGYTATKETTNFAKFSWVIVDVCRDAIFDIVSLEIAPVDIPKEIKANPLKVKLFPDQRKSICNKAGGAAPNNEDFDLPSLYTILRNLCIGILPPTRGWFDNTVQNHPLPADVRVSDDVERLRNKRNALFGHIKRAEMSDSDFQREISEIKQIFTRLDNHLGKHYVDAVTKIETCCMDPETEQKYIQNVEEQQKKDTETRELLKIEQNNVSEIRQKFEKLTQSHDEERTRHKQTRRDVVHTNKALKDLKEDQTKTGRSLVKLEENQREEKTLHEQTRSSVRDTKKALIAVRDDQKKTKKVLMELQEKQKQHKSEHKQTREAMIETKNSVRKLRARHEDTIKKSEEQFQLVRGKQESIVEQLEAEKLKTEDDRGLLQALQLQQAEVKADMAALQEDQSTKLQEADKPKLQETKLQDHLCQSYHDDETLKVSILPSAHDVPLSEVFTKVVIREDLENTWQQEGETTANITHHQDTGQTSDSTNKEMDSYRDLFYKDEVLRRNIYLLGQAGSGKTTFCKHLVDVWCKSGKAHFRNVEEINKFEYVFLVSCRDAESSDSILDMIVDQLLDSETEYLFPTVRFVLNRKPDKCLILVDGLDEWAGSPSRSTGARSPCGLPNRKGLENCVVLTTSRPWRIEALRQGLGKHHRILEIQGLNDSGMKTLSLNLLSALNVLHKSDTFNDFMADVEASKMTEIVKNPLMLIIVLTIWLAERKLDKSLCVNFSGMIECLIQRAEGVSGMTNDTNRLADISQLPKLKSEWAKQNRSLPHCFVNMALCNQFAPLIYKLAHFAFDSLFDEIKEKSLVFSIDELETVFKKPELEVCLKIGIFSTLSAPVKSIKRLTKVSFLHKSLQEFLAALWMADTESQSFLTVFKSHCQSLTDVFDYSKVVMFIYGIAPDKGRELWSCIREMTMLDQVVQEHRRTVSSQSKHVRDDFPASRAVIRLHQLALDCSIAANHSQPVQSGRHFNICMVPDVYVDDEMSSDQCDLVYSQVLASPTGIRSLIVDRTDLDPVLLQNLHKLANLERLHIILQTGLSLQLCSRIYSDISRLTSLKSLFMYMGHNCTDIDNVCHLNVHFPLMRRLTLMGSLPTSPRLHLSFPVDMISLSLYGVALSHQSMISMISLFSSSVSLRRLNIRGLQCFECGRGNCRFDVDLANHSQLELLKLIDLNHEVHTVRVSPTMTRLRWIEMFGIQMSSQSWENFLLSLPLATLRQLTVWLNSVIIDADSVRYIERHFTVTNNYRRSDGYRNIEFHQRPNLIPPLPYTRQTTKLSNNYVYRE